MICIFCNTIIFISQSPLFSIKNYFQCLLSISFGKMKFVHFIFPIYFDSILLAIFQFTLIQFYLQFYNFNLIQFYLLIIEKLKLEEGLGLLIPITELAYVNFPVQLKFWGFTVPCIVLTLFYTDDENSWLETQNCTCDGLLRLICVP